MADLLLRNRFAFLTLLLPLLLSASLLLYNHYNHKVSTDLTETNAMTDLTPPVTSATATASTTEMIFGVKIERKPSKSKLAQLEVASWSTWEGSPSKFPWTFTAKETMYLLEGKVKVYCDGYDGSFVIGGGDLVEFPKGMKVTWDVTEAVKKHYKLEK
ncbi:hypothetical protein NMG60_11036454 [Bertholletia excelsa]